MVIRCSVCGSQSKLSKGGQVLYKGCDHVKDADLVKHRSVDGGSKSKISDKKKNKQKVKKIKRKVKKKVKKQGIIGTVKRFLML